MKLIFQVLLFGALCYIAVAQQEPGSSTSAPVDSFGSPDDTNKTSNEANDQLGGQSDVEVGTNNVLNDDGYGGGIDEQDGQDGGDDGADDGENKEEEEEQQEDNGENEEEEQSNGDEKDWRCSIPFWKDWIPECNEEIDDGTGEENNGVETGTDGNEDPGKDVRSKFFAPQKSASKGRRDSKKADKNHAKAVKEAPKVNKNIPKAEKHKSTAQKSASSKGRRDSKKAGKNHAKAVKEAPKVNKNVPKAEKNKSKAGKAKNNPNKNH